MTNDKVVRAADLRPVPRFALRRVEAAASIGLSPSKFDQLVRDGRMPKPKRVDRAVLWDAEAVRLAWLTLPDEGEGDPNEWDAAT